MWGRSVFCLWQGSWDHGTGHFKQPSDMRCTGGAQYGKVHGWRPPRQLAWAVGGVQWAAGGKHFQRQAGQSASTPVHRTKNGQKFAPLASTACSVRDPAAVLYGFCPALWARPEPVCVLQQSSTSLPLIRLPGSARGDDISPMAQLATDATTTGAIEMQSAAGAAAVTECARIPTNARAISIHRSEPHSAFACAHRRTTASLRGDSTPLCA